MNKSTRRVSHKEVPIRYHSAGQFVQPYSDELNQMKSQFSMLCAKEQQLMQQIQREEEQRRSELHSLRKKIKRSKKSIQGLEAKTIIYQGQQPDILIQEELQFLRARIQKERELREQTTAEFHRLNKSVLKQESDIIQTKQSDRENQQKLIRMLKDYEKENQMLKGKLKEVLYEPQMKRSASVKPHSPIKKQVKKKSPIKKTENTSPIQQHKSPKQSSPILKSANTSPLRNLTNFSPIKKEIVKITKITVSTSPLKFSPKDEGTAMTQRECNNQSVSPIKPEVKAAQCSPMKQSPQQNTQRQDLGDVTNRKVSVISSCSFYSNSVPNEDDGLSIPQEERSYREEIKENKESSPLISNSPLRLDDSQKMDIPNLSTLDAAQSEIPEDNSAIIEQSNESSSPLKVPSQFNLDDTLQIPPLNLPSMNEDPLNQGGSSTARFDEKLSKPDTSVDYQRPLITPQATMSQRQSLLTPVLQQKRKTPQNLSANSSIGYITKASESDERQDKQQHYSQRGRTSLSFSSSKPPSRSPSELAREERLRFAQQKREAIELKKKEDLQFKLNEKACKAQVLIEKKNKFALDRDRSLFQRKLRLQYETEQRKQKSEMMKSLSKKQRQDKVMKRDETSSFLERLDSINTQGIS